MRARDNCVPISDKRMLSIAEAANYLGLGTTKAKEWLIENKALRRFGRSTLYDKKIIDEALDGLQK